MLELDHAANNTTPSTAVTDSGSLAVAEKHHGGPVLYDGSWNDGARLRFSGSVYFMSCAGVACVAAVCFVGLHCCCYRPGLIAAANSNDDDAAAQSQNADDQETAAAKNRVALPPPPSSQLAPASVPEQPKTSASTSTKEESGGTYSGPPQTTTVTTVLDDGTERQSSVLLREVEQPVSQCTVDVKRASSGGGRSQRRRATVAGSPRPDVEAPLTTSTPASGTSAGLVARNRRHVKPLRFRLKSIDVPPMSGGRPKLFRLLIVIVVWTSAVVGGPLSTVTSYACYPTDSRAFVAGAVVADAVAALACAAATRATAGRGDVSTVIAMTCLGTIVLVYYTALVLFSLQPQPHQLQHAGTRVAEMPLFGSTAEMLAVSCFYNYLVTGQSPWAQALTVAYRLFTRSVCLRACIPLERKLNEICTFDSSLSWVPLPTQPPRSKCDLNVNVLERLLTETRLLEQA